MLRDLHASILALLATSSPAPQGPTASASLPSVPAACSSGRGGLDEEEGPEVRFDAAVAAAVAHGSAGHVSDGRYDCCASLDGLLRFTCCATAYASAKRLAA